MTKAESRAAALNLGAKLKRIAQGKSIPQTAISVATGLPPKTVNQILNGKMPANSERLCLIADAIGAEVKIEETP